MMIDEGRKDAWQCRLARKVLIKICMAVASGGRLPHGSSAEEWLAWIRLVEVNRKGMSPFLIARTRRALNERMLGIR